MLYLVLNSMYTLSYTISNAFFVVILVLYLRVLFSVFASVSFSFTMHYVIEAKQGLLGSQG